MNSNQKPGVHYRALGLREISLVTVGARKFLGSSKGRK